jgi:hypothetical protein
VRDPAPAASTRPLGAAAGVWDRCCRRRRRRRAAGAKCRRPPAPFPRAHRARCCGVRPRAGAAPRRRSTRRRCSSAAGSWWAPTSRRGPTKSETPPWWALRGASSAGWRPPPPSQAMAVSARGQAAPRLLGSVGRRACNEAARRALCRAPLLTPPSPPPPLALPLPLAADELMPIADFLARQHPSAPSLELDVAAVRLAAATLRSVQPWHGFACAEEIAAARPALVRAAARVLASTDPELLGPSQDEGAPAAAAAAGAECTHWSETLRSAAAAAAACLERQRALLAGCSAHRCPPRPLHAVQPSGGRCGRTPCPCCPRSARPAWRGGAPRCLASCCWFSRRWSPTRCPPRATTRGRTTAPPSAPATCAPAAAPRQPAPTPCSPTSPRNGSTRTRSRRSSASVRSAIFFFFLLGWGTSRAANGGYDATTITVHRVQALRSAGAAAGRRVQHGVHHRSTCGRGCERAPPKRCMAVGLGGPAVIPREVHMHVN